MPKEPKICVLLPTLNEAENIAQMIEDIRDVCSYPIFVIDQQSTDGTAEIAEEKGVPVFQREKKGYGEGVKKGMSVALKKGYDMAILLDCDRTYPPKHIPELVEHALDYDLVMGCRPMKKVMFAHRYANILLNLTISVLYFGWMKDINTGMKLFDIKKFYGNVPASGMDFTAQFSTVALRNRYRIKQVPIDYHDRSYDKSKGKAKIRYRDGFVMLWRIIHDRFLPPRVN